MAATKLREYERDWLKRVIRSDASRTLIVGPTGSGKTVIASALCRRAFAANKAVLFLVHRRELAAQAIESLRRMGIPQHSIGAIVGGTADGFEARPNAVVQVASIQALSNQEELPKADLIIIDEAHHAAAPSYQALLTRYPHAVVYGLTATPYRLDGQPLGSVFETIVESAKPSELIDAGWLVRPTVYTVPPELRADLKRVRERAGEYDQAALARAVDKAPLIGSLVEHWKRLAARRPTVCYAVGIEHAVHIVESFREAGVTSELVCGVTPLDERAKLLEAIEDGALEVLVNVGVLLEGWDAPAVKCAVVARPTLSRVLWHQMVGRLTRPHWGAKPPIVLDHAGNAVRHGMPLLDWTYSLTEAMPNTRKSSHGEKCCPRCDCSQVVLNRVCDWCGFAWWEPGGVPEEVPAKLVKVGGEEKLFVQCAYEHCPTPDKPVLWGGATEKPTHYQCKTLRAQARDRTCVYPECPKKHVPVSPQAVTQMHRSCINLLSEKAPRRPTQCQYERCPKPLDLIKSRGTERVVMHRDCRRMLVAAERVCQYEHCPYPEVLLGKKAPFIGTRMHRTCAGKARSQRAARGAKKRGSSPRLEWWQTSQEVQPMAKSYSYLEKLKQRGPK